MYCKKCGQEIDATGKFCPHCGAPVEDNEAPGKKQKKGKKPFYKRWWFWVIVVILLLGSCGNETDTPAETTPATETVATELPAETTEAIMDTVAVEESTATSAADLDAAVVLIESILKDNFENFEIYHEDNIITINVWDDGITMGAILAASGDADCLTSWNDLVESQKELCDSLCNFVDTLGLDDVTVLVNVLNDENKENVLLSVAEGIVFYDCVNDQ